ncbi:MAG: beta-N-acetylhexosaminidase, partial [Halomonas sp.]
MTQPLGPVMLDLEGPALTRDEKHLLLEPTVGGVILFARNV